MLRAPPLASTKDSYPRKAHVYVADRLHMTPAGDEIWNRVVGPVLAGLTHVH